MRLYDFLKKNEGVFVGVLKSVLIGLLKMQATGGIRGWLLKTLVTEFSKEIIEIITVTIDYVEIKHIIKETENDQDRNNATDTLNDIIK